MTRQRGALRCAACLLALCCRWMEFLLLSHGCAPWPLSCLQSGLFLYACGNTIVREDLQTHSQEYFQGLECEISCLKYHPKSGLVAAASAPGVEEDK